MSIEKLMNKKLPSVPKDLNIDNANVTFVPFSDKNAILKNEDIQRDAGHVKYDKGHYVAMYCDMHGVTKDMLDWWFWWHPQADERYKAWFPGAHKKIGYAKKNENYFTLPIQPLFKDNVQYPRETIGNQTATLRISFVSPEEFGFDEDVMEKNGIVGAVCGHVGIKGLFDHTEMCHIMKQTDEGILLISRFWMGESLDCKLLKKTIMTNSLAHAMTEHCCIEYRNLAEILPDLYREYRK